jgi:hypothetical protein
MTTPQNGEISMEDINLELDLFTPAANLELKNDFYQISQNTGGVALMYHNLNMATGNATTAKVAIYDPYNANANMTMSNWYNYTRDAQVVMTYSVQVASSVGYNVQVAVGILDSTGTNVGTIFSGVVQNNTTSSGTSTGPPALTIIGSAGYRIELAQVDILGIPPGNSKTVSFSVTASDTDGVGGGTTRTTTNPGNYTQATPPPFPTPPFTPTVIVDTSGGLIAINKRTTVSIVIS